MIKHKQNGFHLTALLLFFLVTVVIGAVGYFVWQKQDGKSPQDEDMGPVVVAEKPAQPCKGEWIDTHTHADNEGFGDELVKRMDENDVGCSLIFVHADIEDPETSMLKIRDEYSPNPGRFILFADIVRDDPKLVTKTNLENFFGKNPGVFRGIGENAFYRQPFTGTSLLAEPWPTIFQYAAENDLFVMLHLTVKEMKDLETMLTKYPSTKVLLHHKELKAELPRLLKTYKNLYYTLDTTNLLTVPQGDRDEVIMYPHGEGNANQFLKRYGEVKAGRIAAAKDWLPELAAAPDRIMWGTDASFDWHIDKAVYNTLVGFSAELIKQIPENYHGGYKFDNALKSFKEGVTLKPLTEQELDKLDSADED